MLELPQTGRVCCRLIARRSNAYMIEAARGVPSLWDLGPPGLSFLNGTRRWPEKGRSHSTRKTLPVVQRDLGPASCRGGS